MQKSRLISFGGYQPAGLELLAEFKEFGHALAFGHGLDREAVCCLKMMMNNFRK
jgi:hypothetical protein